MTLSVVVGSSGSGKTTFLNDGMLLRSDVCRCYRVYLYSFFVVTVVVTPHSQLVTLSCRATNCYETIVAKQHKCTYIRQYHGIRPYITVTKIPRFDPTRLRT
jgi:hypothetical protein